MCRRLAGRVQNRMVRGRRERWRARPAAGEQPPGDQQRRPDGSTDRPARRKRYVDRVYVRTNGADILSRRTMLRALAGLTMLGVDAALVACAGGPTSGV